MTSIEIMKKQNEICVKEFEENYKFSEIARVFKNETEEPEYKKLAKALEAEINSHLEEGYRVTVDTSGNISFFKHAPEIDKNAWTQLKYISSKACDLLPYSYIMGKAVSKKLYESTKAAFEIFKEAAR